MALLLFVAALSLSAQSISLQYAVINNFPVKYVLIDMKDPQIVVAPAVATAFPKGLDTWGSFINRLHPDVAINGTYFCPRSYQPVGDIAIEGALVYRGDVGTALCISPNNQVDFLPGPKQQKRDWRGYRTVICAGPRLLTKGAITVNARAEGFRDPNVLGSAPRSAVALRADNVLIFLTISCNTSLGNLAAVCAKLGAVEAMTLDGGSSSGLYANGRTITRPQRSLSNMLVVYGNQHMFQSAKLSLIPRQVTSFAQLLAPGYSPVIENVIETPPLVPSYPDPPSALNNTASLIKISPSLDKQLRGQIPLSIEITTDTRYSWASLRINGELAAMTGSNHLNYYWETAREVDGPIALEVTLWTADKKILEQQTITAAINNSSSALLAATNIPWQ